jgi:Fe-S oxidoreductase
VTARILALFAPLVNSAAALPPVRRIAARVIHTSPRRPFPRFARHLARPKALKGSPPVLILRDPFTHFVESEVEQAAFDLLSCAGFEVHALKSMGAGASLVSHGFLPAARQHAQRLMKDLYVRDPTGSIPLVVIEPSELSTLRHDYADLVPDASAATLERLRHAQSVEQWLVGTPWFNESRGAVNRGLLGYHPHCHESSDALRGGGASTVSYPGVELLRCCGYEVEPLPAGCCGMAGTFGYEAEHFELSQRILQGRLLPAIKNLAVRTVGATGAACRMQITQSGEVVAQHPLVLAARALIAT